jgi:hypothetical protein
LRSSEKLPSLVEIIIINKLVIEEIEDLIDAYTFFDISL